MKGENRFTNSQIEKIRKILVDLRNSDKDEQKRLRDKLRSKFRFYITDFDLSYSGFSVDDFNSLISKDLIKVID